MKLESINNLYNHRTRYNNRANNNQAFDIKEEITKQISQISPSFIYIEDENDKRKRLFKECDNILVKLRKLRLNTLNNNISDNNITELQAIAEYAEFLSDPIYQEVLIRAKVELAKLQLRFNKMTTA
jgi:hypothetical protein